MDSPILKKIGTVFIPVSNIKKARDWYCDVLGIKPEGEILFDHLFVISMEGTGIVLDSKIYSEDRLFKTPAFHFNTKNIEEAFQFLKNKGVNIITEIQHNHYINFTDPDGNVLMICE